MPCPEHIKYTGLMNDDPIAICSHHLNFLIFCIVVFFRLYLKLDIFWVKKKLPLAQEIGQLWWMNMHWKMSQFCILSDTGTLWIMLWCFNFLLRYYSREDAEDAVKYISGTILDDRPIRVDFDWGFEDGRQWGRGRSGGQVCFLIFVVIYFPIFLVLYQWNSDALNMVLFPS